MLFIWCTSFIKLQSLFLNQLIFEIFNFSSFWITIVGFNSRFNYEKYVVKILKNSHI